MAGRMTGPASLSSPDRPGRTIGPGCRPRTARTGSPWMDDVKEQSPTIIPAPRWGRTSQRAGPGAGKAMARIYRPPRTGHAPAKPDRVPGDASLRKTNYVCPVHSLGRSNNTATDTRTAPMPPEINAPMYSALKAPRPAAKSKMVPITPIHVAKCSRDDESIISPPDVQSQPGYGTHQVERLDNNADTYRFSSVRTSPSNDSLEEMIRVPAFDVAAIFAYSRHRP